MSQIHALIQHIMKTGYFTLEAEAHLRYLLQKTKYGREDINAFVNLQKAVMEGQVRQNSRELIRSALS